jgi:hypothetical protein
MSQLNPGRNIGAKSKIEIHVGILDFFKYFKKTNEESEIDYSTYSQVIKDLNEEISKAVILDGFEFKLPGRLGYISIIKKKHRLKTNENGKVDTRYLPVDFKKTKELWAEIYPDKTEAEILAMPDRKRVFHTNTHSDGFIYSWYYNKFTSNATNKSVYYFNPTRTNQRLLSAYVKSEDFANVYYEFVN